MQQAAHARITKLDQANYGINVLLVSFWYEKNGKLFIHLDDREATILTIPVEWLNPYARNLFRVDG